MAIFVGLPHDDYDGDDRCQSSESASKIQYFYPLLVRTDYSSSKLLSQCGQMCPEVLILKHLQSQKSSAEEEHVI